MASTDSPPPPHNDDDPSTQTDSLHLRDGMDCVPPTESNSQKHDSGDETTPLYDDPDQVRRDRIIIGCGVLQIVCGILLFLFGARFCKFIVQYRAGIGGGSILTGMLAFLGGIFGVRSGIVPSARCSAVITMILSIITAILSGCGVAYWAISAMILLAHEFDPDVEEVDQSESSASMLWISVMTLQISVFVEFVVAILQSAYSCTICCKKQPVRIVYVPISVSSGDKSKKE